MVLDEGFLKFGSFLAIKDQVYYSALSGGKTNVLVNQDLKVGVQIQNFFDRDSQFYCVPSWQRVSVPAFQSLIQAELISSIKNPDQFTAMTSSQDLIGRPPPSLWSEPDLGFFQSQFNWIRQKIQIGEWIKAVPITSSYRHVPQTQNVDILNLIQSALRAVQINPNLMAYGWWNFDEGIIGITPEILYCHDGEKVKTVAVAGTRPVTSESSRLPLLEDPKELHEHQIVIEDIKQRLAPFGELTVHNTHVVTLPKLEHLKTDIHLKPLPEYKNLDYSQILHPTAALGIFPRSDKAMEELKTQSHQQNRKRFGAPITFHFNAGQKVSLVMIRNIQWTHGEQRIFAGVGQVQESQFEREWQEVCDKINMVKTLLLGDEK